jgi:hypothetical protein
MAIVVLPYLQEDNFEFFVVHEVPTAMVINSSLFWDITQCKPLQVNRYLGERVASIFIVDL